MAGSVYLRWLRVRIRCAGVDCYAMTPADQIAELRRRYNKVYRQGVYGNDPYAPIACDALALAEELAQRLEETECASVSDQTDD